MQIADHIHAIKIPFVSAGGENKTAERFVYVFLIYGEKICIVDGGVSSSFPKIVDYLKKTGRSIEEVSMLLHTHSHPDHIGSSPAIKEASGCRVAAHVDAKPWIEDIDLQYRNRPTATFYSLVSGPVNVDLILNDGDILDIGNGQTLRIFHTPGHSQGSVSFFYEPDKALFSGDALPVPGDRPLYEDVFTIIESTRKLKQVKGLKVLCSSWLDPQYDEKIYEVMDATLAHIQHIHEIVLKTAEENPALDETALCARILRDLGHPEIPNVVKSIQAHLQLRRYRNLLQGELSVGGMPV